jgi:hypothetical protein
MLSLTLGLSPIVTKRPEEVRRLAETGRARRIVTTAAKFDLRATATARDTPSCETTRPMA